MKKFDEKYCIEIFEKLLAVDSTTGFYEESQRQLCRLLEELGYPYETVRKGGVIADLGGEGDALCITAHLDDIGLMVRHLNADGTLNVCPVGGLYPFYCMMENVRVHTREGKVYTGSVCRTPNSVHVTEEELRVTPPDFRSNVCVVLDEDVHSAAEVRALGIETGDSIALGIAFFLIQLVTVAQTHALLLGHLGSFGLGLSHIAYRQHDGTHHSKKLTVSRHP